MNKHRCQFLDQIVYRLVEEEYNTSLECKGCEKKHKIKQNRKELNAPPPPHLQKQKHLMLLKPFSLIITGYKKYIATYQSLLFEMDFPRNE